MEEQSQDQEYFEKRSLKSGAAGWVLLTGLGVAYVVSGDFSGWNYGIAYGGWLGLAIAFLAMGCMYACTVFGIAELSSAIPTAGAGYGFARRAFGRFGGFMTGLAVLIEYVCAPAAISTFIANYLDAIGLVSGDGGHLLAVAVCYALFIAVHIIGVGEALKTMLVITVVAVVALVVFIVGALPGFDFSRLFDIAPAAGGSALLPYGVAGVLAALPFGIWFFLGIEGVPLGSEEARDPRKDVPRAIIGAMAVLVLTGMAVLFLAAGNTGASFMGQSTAPLVDVLERAGQPALGLFVNVAGLFGLVASFFSLIYAGSRQMFALSRAGADADPDARRGPRDWRRPTVPGRRKPPLPAMRRRGGVKPGRRLWAYRPRVAVRLHARNRSWGTMPGRTVELVKRLDRKQIARARPRDRMESASVSVHGRRLEPGGGAYVPDPSRLVAARNRGDKTVDCRDDPPGGGHPPQEREERSDREQHGKYAEGQTPSAKVRPPLQRWPNY